MLQPLIGSSKVLITSWNDAIDSIDQSCMVLHGVCVCECKTVCLLQHYVTCLKAAPVQVFVELCDSF